MASKRSVPRNEISNDTILAMYPIVRRVARKELSRTEGITEVVNTFNMNQSSARDYIDFFGKLLKGEEYWRVNPIYCVNLFLQRMREDFGIDALRKAISAVDLHLTYYLEKTGNNQPGIRKVVENHREFISSPTNNSGDVLATIANEMEAKGLFDPTDDMDDRDWALRSIALRQGQPRFRAKLIRIYRTRCAISGCRVEAVLEAAHIIQYRGTKSHRIKNGLLLRTDLHTLFDRKLIAIDSASMTILVSAELKGSIYEKSWAGKKLRLPKDKANWPDKGAIDSHRKASGL